MIGRILFQGSIVAIIVALMVIIVEVDRKYMNKDCKCGIKHYGKIIQKNIQKGIDKLR